MKGLGVSNGLLCLINNALMGGGRGALQLLPGMYAKDEGEGL